MSAKALLSASVSAPPAVYIEDTFSTFLYTGNGSTQTITNGIDLAGEGGLVWIKSRSAATDNQLFDTERGATEELISNSTAAESADADTLTAFNADGFDLGADSNTNTSAATYCSWTFRKAAKFFDIVTFTSGTNTNRRISHSLGSVPGMIILKRTDDVGGWLTYHRSIGRDAYLEMNSTASTGGFTITNVWGTSDPTSTDFGIDETNLTGASRQFVGYVFAHDAGGFGDAGTDNVVSCGSFTTDGSGNFTNQNIGFEPQWLMLKSSTTTDPWIILDSMRGLNLTQYAQLFANTNGAENAGNTAYVFPTATGFGGSNGNLDASATYIYIAIRRGPMKTPTVGTEVFSANAFTSSSNGVTTTGFPPDLVLYANRDRSAFSNSRMADRLRGAITSGSGVSLDLMTESTAAEGAVGSNIVSTDNVSFKWQSGNAGYSMVSESFRRAPGFFDVVAYTGTGSATTVSHNLGVVPELMIVKCRSAVVNWTVYSKSLPISDHITLNSDSTPDTNSNRWNNTSPTSAVFSLSSNSAVNGSGNTYIAYLFATLTGVSKVGSYTGTGTTLSIDCGFTAGARLVLIKRTDSTGDWFVWDTARGIVSGNDSYLLLNSTAAEVTNTDYIDPLSSGFQISSTAPAAINASGGSFIFLAIA
jgi:hypothetical protein